MSASNFQRSLAPNGRAFIEAWEGLYLKAYDDGTGVWTIGYGHTTPAGLPRVYPGILRQSTSSEYWLS